MSKKRYINYANHELSDTMVIGAGHALMLGNIPDPIRVEDNLTKLNENFFAWKGTTQESIQSLGFFGSDINYHTYYPDLKAEDLKPKDEEFINPMFRLLSATVVSKNWMPTDFSKNGALKASMSKLLGQTVNCDHETNIGNAIGSVSEVIWQEAYKAEGFSIPAGINGVLKIDGKANPRIARGILMDPPSIHSNSVTVQFKWDKSHPDLSDNDFWDKLGTYDDKGNMICRVVTEVIRYMETSLVSHGADPYAQKVDKNGKIVNPGYANNTYNSYSEYQEDNKKCYYFSDNKNIETDDTPVSFNENQGLENPIKNNTNMNPELQAFLDRLFGNNMLVLEEGKEATQEEAISLISSIIKERDTLTQKLTDFETEKTTLSEKITSLESEVASLKEYAQVGKDYITSLREKVVSNYKKLVGDKLDEKDPVFVMLNAENTPLITIEGLNKSYEQKLQEAFPMKCNHCGSKDVSRASSVEEPEDTKEDTTKNSEVVETAQAFKDIIARKNRYKSSN